MLGNTSKGNLDRILCLYRKICQTDVRSGIQSSLATLFLELGWLPIHDIIKLMHATIVFKVLNGLSPSYITDFTLSFFKLHNIDRRGNRRNLKLPKANTNSDKRTFAFLTSSEWNLLLELGDPRQLCKHSTSSRVCITVSNSPNRSRVYIRLCKQGKRFLLLK